jgi:hypothetical protein
MKKMTTVLTMIALAFMLSTTTLGQSGKRNKRATPIQPSNVISDAAGDPIGHVRGITRNGYTGTTTVNQGLRKNDTLSGGSGNDAAKAAKAKRQSEAGQPDHLTDFGPTGSLSVGGSTNARQNHRAAGFLTADPHEPRTPEFHRCLVFIGRRLEQVY